MAKPKSKSIDKPLLQWYDRHRRVMPWRAMPGKKPNAYHVWLSEIMLQQTTVATVAPYFKDFLARWPTLKTLANAKQDDVLAAWAGLGYYSRARNLHKCAQVIVAEHNGALPDDYDALLALPGIGPYTAAAISAIAFDKPANVVDGNVERVMARLFAVKTKLPAAKKELTALAATLVPQGKSGARVGDYAQALMDLGATVCTPRVPKCDVCPLASHCAAKALGKAEAFPARGAKAAVPHNTTMAYVVQRADGAVLLRRRADTGLLARMVEVPNDGLQTKSVLRLPVKVARWQQTPETVGHVFSHFRLTVTVKHARVTGARPALPAPYFWVRLDKLAQQALPTVMRKVLAAAGIDG